MPNISEKTFIDSIHFCGDDDGDWMATLYRPGDGEPWELEYRFRYYENRGPGTAWDGEDRKSWYQAKAPDDSEENCRAMRTALDNLRPALEARYGSSVDVVELQCYGDDPKFIFELGSRDWANIKVGADAEKYMKGGDGELSVPGEG